MSSKSLKKSLEKMGYILGTDIFGWIVISKQTGQEWKFPTLGGVSRFVSENS